MTASSNQVGNLVESIDYQNAYITSIENENTRLRGELARREAEVIRLKVKLAEDPTSAPYWKAKAEAWEHKHIEAIERVKYFRNLASQNQQQVNDLTYGRGVV